MTAVSLFQLVLAVWAALVVASIAGLWVAAYRAPADLDPAYSDLDSADGLIDLRSQPIGGSAGDPGRCAAGSGTTAAPFPPP